MALPAAFMGSVRAVAIFTGLAMVEFVADQLPTTPSRTAAGLSVGFEGGEVMSGMEIAMIGKLPYTALGDATFAHPRLAGSLNNLFMAMDRGS